MENLSDKQTNWCVYMHENRVNGKKYIGITSQKPTNRWANGRGYKRCPFFYAAIEKYGWDCFKHEILYTGLEQGEAEKLEIELIAKYETQNQEKGYNLSSGGSVNAGFHRTDEFKKKLSETRKMRYSGKNHNMYGTHPSEETKMKIRNAQIGRPKPPEVCAKLKEAAAKRWVKDNTSEREHLRQLNLGGKSARAVAVCCVETGEIFPAIREASRKLNIEVSGIIRCCEGLRKTAGGYHWTYYRGEVSRDGQ